MKLHLPVRLRKAVLACFSVVSVCTLYSGGIAAAADLTLAEADSLAVDYADSSSITDLSGGTLTLAGGTELLLTNCDEGDGKTYTLLTGVSSLLDVDGNPLTLTEENKAASLYFDTTQPGTGFWAGAWLQLAPDGTVQLVLHGEEVREALTITTRQTSNLEYNYYEGVCFRDITASSGPDTVYGGAIKGGTITLSNNGSVTFSGNTASGSDNACGGAIYGETITLSNNGSVTFSGNTASGSDNAWGGAIDGDYGWSNSSITLSHNGSVTFSGNTAASTSSSSTAYGGAIYGVTITLSNNGSVAFSGNTASATGTACGGAIYGTITLSHNGSVTFSGNTASGSYFACGGAIYGTITLSNNGSVTFSGNTASGSDNAYGGAIYEGTNSSITLSHNGSVSFRGNKASSTSSNALGGAIYKHYGIFSIQNNASVVFEKNYALEKETLRLQSIYAYDVEDAGKEMLVNFSAPKGGKIEFRDSIQLDVDSNSASAFHLNNWYVDDAGERVAQTGDIIFTGEDATAENLKAILAEHGIHREATADEIRLSKTSEVSGTMQLHDGRLIVRDGAIIEADGITVHGSASGDSTPTLWLNNGELRPYLDSFTRKNAVTISGGCALRLSGKNTVRNSTLTLSAGSTLIIDVAAAHADTAALTLDSSSLTQSGALTLILKGENSLVHGQSYKLLTGLTRPDTWTAANITVESGTAGWEVCYDDLTWDDDTLWIYYEGEIQELPLPEPEPLPKPEFVPDLNRNQQEVYDTVKDIVAGGEKPEGELGKLVELISGSRNEAELRELLDAVGGSEYATLMSSQLDGNLAHVRNLRNRMGSGWELVGNNYMRAMIEMFGQHSEVDGDAHGRGYTRSEMGGQFTLEFIGCMHMSSGVALASGHTRLNPDDALRQSVNNNYVDFYTTYRGHGHCNMGYSAKFSLGIGTHDYNLRRNVPGTSTMADADGFSVNFMHESAYMVRLSQGSSLQVFGVVESSFSSIGGFREKGAGTASLVMESQDAWATDITLGLRYVQLLDSFALPQATLTLQAGVTAGVGDTSDSLHLHFAGAPDKRYYQTGADRNRRGYNLGVGLHVPVSNTSAFYMSGETILRGDSYEWNGNVGFQIAF